jgi:membrane fusion protein, multidrug efflux system
MFGRLELAFQARQDALVVPESALSFRGDQVVVVVRNGDGAAEFRPVRPGLRLAGFAEIIEGLAEGEQVVVEGFQKMGPGTPIAISPKSARYGLEPESVPGN